jgi:hypothetical protein
MGEKADKAFLLGDAVLNDLVADQEGLYARFYNIWHSAIVRESCTLSKMMCFSAEEGGMAACGRALVYQERARMKGGGSLSEADYPIITALPRLSATWPNRVSPVPMRQ